MFVKFSFCSLNFPCFWKYIKVNQDPKNSVEYFSEGKLPANSSDHFLPTLGNKCANRYGDYADGKKSNSNEFITAFSTDLFAFE